MNETKMASQATRPTHTMLHNCFPVSTTTGPTNLPPALPTILATCGPQTLLHPVLSILCAGLNVLRAQTTIPTSSTQVERPSLPNPGRFPPFSQLHTLDTLRTAYEDVGRSSSNPEWYSLSGEKGNVGYCASPSAPSSSDSAAVLRLNRVRERDLEWV